nr:UDP-N-acetylglucosamine--N-acetylmuramyl-(pentapeptide) pyrophosphoryl-undecaprenol N-acetylglucosamine transferase [Pseudomonadota bacterium]
AELAAAGVGAVLVPFPYAVDDHQSANARYPAGHGAAVVAPQSEMTAEALAALLAGLLADRPRLLAMAEAARRLARADAAQQVAMHCLEWARNGARAHE